MPGTSKPTTSQLTARHVSRKQFLSGATAVFAVTATPALAGKTTSRASETAPAKPGSSLSALNTTEIAPGVFIHTGVHAIYAPENGGDISNAAFVIGENAVAVIDTGGTYKIGMALKAAIREKTDRPIRYVINTHMHPDHVFGNAAFEMDGTEFVAHHKMARGLAARAERYLAINKRNVGDDAFAGTKIILPTRGIKESQKLDLGARTLTLLPQATAHTDNDLVIFDDKTKTLFLGDLLFSRHCPTVDGSILGWLRVIDALSTLSAMRVVPGHGPSAMKWPDALTPQKQYLQSIVTQVRRLIAEGKTLGEAMKLAGHDESGNWVLFDEFHRRNISVAFAELEWE